MRRAPASIDKEAIRRKYLEERDKRLRADGNDQYLQPKGRLAYFRYLDEWRRSGAFEGLEFCAARVR